MIRLIKIIKTVIKLIILAAILAIGLNVFVIMTTKDQIASDFTDVDYKPAGDEIAALKAIEPECIMVLGASVRADGTPSSILKDRLDVALALYREGVAPKILLTGDNGQVEYNEVRVMGNYMEANGVSAENIFLDHAGFSTYESIYRAGNIFKVRSMVVVTQKYHLYRSLYGCNSMGIKAMGVASNQNNYSGQINREVREILARDKDAVKWVIKPNPTYLGEAIPISGSGIVTH